VAKKKRGRHRKNASRSKAVSEFSEKNTALGKKHIGGLVQGKWGKLGANPLCWVQCGGRQGAGGKGRKLVSRSNMKPSVDKMEVHLKVEGTENHVQRGEKTQIGAKKV